MTDFRAIRPSPNPAAATDCDVLIIGAGPAGAVAATLLARRGMRVQLVERKPFPRRKVCGACLSGHALRQFAAADLLACVEEAGSLPVTGFLLGHNGRSAAVPLTTGQILSRSALDAAIVDAAVTAGATFLPETTASIGPPIASGRTVQLLRDRQEQTLTAKVVIAAAGLSGLSFRGEEQLQPNVSPRARLGAGAEVPNADGFYRSGVIYMATGRAGYVGLTRVETGALNVAAALEATAVREAGGLNHAAERIVRSAGFPTAGLRDADWTGTPALTRRPDRVAGERLFLVGDTAGYVEPFTGEGIGWAVGSAVAVVPLVEQAMYGWNERIAADWTDWHRTAIRRRQRMCRWIAQGLRLPWLLSAAVHLLRPYPGLAQPIVQRLAS